MSIINELALLGNIESAFGTRKKPDKLLSGTMSADEIGEVSYIAEKTWRELSSNIWEDNFEAIYWLSPNAFCYYLPGILYTSINEHNPDLLVINSIINMLNRSTDSSNWDEFFSNRWLLLKDAEIDVVSEWIVWLSDSGVFDDITLTKCLDCLENIRHRVRSTVDSDNV